MANSGLSKIVLSTIGLAEGIGADLGSWEHALRTELEALTGRNGDHVNGGDHPDPTFGRMLAQHRLTSEHDLVRDDLLAAFERLRQAQSRMAQRSRYANYAELEAARKARRCEDDPLCERLVVRQGRCWRHYRAWLDQREREAQAVS